MKPKREAKAPTPYQQIIDGLIERGYRRVAEYPQRTNSDTAIYVIEMWGNNKTTLLLTVYGDGSCDLYKPVNDSLLIADTIAAIPQ